MKYIVLTLIALSAVIYPLLVLTSCTEEEMQGKEVSRQEIQAVKEDPSSDIDELERKGTAHRDPQGDGKPPGFDKGT